VSTNVGVLTRSCQGQGQNKVKVEDIQAQFCDLCCEVILFFDKLGQKVMSRSNTYSCSTRVNDKVKL